MSMRSFSPSRVLCAGLAALALGGCASASGPSGQAMPAQRPAEARAGRRGELSDEQRSLAVRSFDLVWETVRTSHWDPNLGGVDWTAVRDSLRPRVEAARTTAQARSAMEAMVGTLGLSHYAIIPRAAAAVMSEEGGGSGGDTGRGGDGVPGFDVRVQDDHVLVVAVDPGSPAEQAGIRPGWELAEAGGTDVRAILQPLRAEFAGRTLLDLTLARAVKARLRGPVGGETKALLRDGEGRQVRLKLPLAPPRGNRAAFGNLPPFYTYLEARTLAGGVGCVRVSAFFDPANVMPAFGKAVESFLTAPGIVIDLRGNPGGIGAMAMGMAGWLVGDEGHVLGTMTTRAGQIKFAVTPRAKTYGGRVAVLVDGLSASTAEILAAGLRDIGRARLFGTRTAGAALPSLILDLPDGDALQYAVANYVSAKGQELEGRGVTPDVIAPPARDALLRGQDPALDAAVAWILQGSRGSERGRCGDDG